MPAGVVIEFTDDLIAVRLEGPAVDQSAAAGVSGNFVEDGCGDRENAAGRNDLIGERLAGERVDDVFRGSSCEITIALRCGDKRDVGVVGTAARRALITSEEEELAADDRSAEAAAELVALECAALGGEEVTRV